MPKSEFEKRRQRLRTSSWRSKLRGYWLTLQLTIALWRSDEHHAKEILLEIKQTVRPLPAFAQWFELNQRDRTPRRTIAPTLKSDAYLTADRAAVTDIAQRLKLNQRDAGLVQCTGIDERVFRPLETCLSKFVRTEFEKRQQRDPHHFHDELHRAIVDLDGLRKGIDPDDSSPQMPYVYLTRYLLDNVYGAYLAWFWVYQRGLLSANFSILDIAAGPGSMAIGLSLLLQSVGQTVALPELNIAYASLEQRDAIQYRGLQFWRRYNTAIADRLRPIGLFFQFHTFDLFDYTSQAQRLPDKRFNFITISHCFFADADRYDRSVAVYRQIFRDRLAPEGLVLLLIQWSKLPGRTRDCSLETERELLHRFVELDLGLELAWGRYISSTGQRDKIESFTQFVRQHCPPQPEISRVARDYFGETHTSHYTLDDYIILARQA
ncbi:MAG: photosystem II assembly protein [Geitlerinemataceae cyanobacterium]